MLSQPQFSCRRALSYWSVFTAAALCLSLLSVSLSLSAFVCLSVRKCVRRVDTHWYTHTCMRTYTQTQAHTHSLNRCLFARGSGSLACAYTIYILHSDNVTNVIIIQNTLPPPTQRTSNHWRNFLHLWTAPGEWTCVVCDFQRTFLWWLLFQRRWK